jgi:hypothetical protein
VNKKEYIDFHKRACEQMVMITQKKNADYTGGGDDPFANFRHIGQLVKSPNVCEIGFLTRMSDKFARIGSYISNGTLQVKDESVEDTLLDLANYCVLMLGFITDKKQARNIGAQTTGEGYGQAQDAR